MLLASCCCLGAISRFPPLCVFSFSFQFLFTVFAFCKIHLNFAVFTNEYGSSFFFLCWSQDHIQYFCAGKFYTETWWLANRERRQCPSFCAVMQGKEEMYIQLFSFRCFPLVLPLCQKSLITLLCFSLFKLDCYLKIRIKHVEDWISFFSFPS